MKSFWYKPKLPFLFRIRTGLKEAGMLEFLERYPVTMASALCFDGNKVAPNIPPEVLFDQMRPSWGDGLEIIQNKKFFCWFRMFVRHLYGRSKFTLHSIHNFSQLHFKKHLQYTRHYSLQKKVKLTKKILNSWMISAPEQPSWFV